MVVEYSKSTFKNTMTLLAQLRRGREGLMYENKDRLVEPDWLERENVYPYQSIVAKPMQDSVYYLLGLWFP